MRTNLAQIPPFGTSILPFVRYTTRIIVPPKIRRSGQPGGGGAYKPQVLGVRKTFSFDDPFGVAVPGQINAAAMHPEFAPVFVQHPFTVPESDWLNPADQMSSTVKAVGNARFRHPWGADANLLGNPQEVEQAAATGFTHFTMDPGALVAGGVAALSPDRIQAALDSLIEEGTLNEDWYVPYLDRTIDLPGNDALRLTLDPLKRAAVTYARAIRHCARLSESVARANQGRPYELEAFFGAMPTEATALEHLFIGLELEARGVRLTSLALRLVGPDDAAAVRQGEVGPTEVKLRQHAAMAEFCGPYKLSFHGVSLLPSLHPLLGVCCGDALHVKTHHLSFLEALRVLQRTDPALFERAADAITERFEGPRGGARARLQRMLAVEADGDWQEDADGSTFLDGCTASLTTAGQSNGRLLRTAITETLEQRADIYHEQLTSLFDKRLSLLKAG